MVSITSIEDALRMAKNFLAEAGIPTILCRLDEVPIRVDNKWIVKFAYSLAFTEEIYTVELDAETGKVIGYKREKRSVK